VLILEECHRSFSRRDFDWNDLIAEISSGDCRGRAALAFTGE
jgi:hypothetical protein